MLPGWSQIPDLSLPKCWITGVSHHAWPAISFSNVFSFQCTSLLPPWLSILLFLVLLEMEQFSFFFFLEQFS